MEDITIIFLNAGKVPKDWAKFHREKLEEAIGNTPVITVSYKPMDWGINLIQKEYSYANVLKQMLRASKIAKTKWIGTADDDTLYPPDHFSFRADEDGFYYNFNRWQLATWKPKFYFHRPIPGNGCMIATRDLLIHKMEERLSIDPDLSGRYHCRELGTWTRWTGFDEPRYFPFYTKDPLVSFVHDFSADPYSRKHKKTIYPIRAHEIPYWRRSEDLARKFS